MPDDDLFADLDGLVSDDPTPDPPPDVQPDPPPDLSNLPACEICGTPIEWAGRGRKPKKCREHRTRTAPRESSGPVSTRRNAKHEERLQQVADDLTGFFTGIGAGLAFGLPTAGTILVQRSERTAKALVRAAQNSPKALDALEKFATVVPMAVVGETVVIVGVAAAVDFGQLKPDSPIARMTGVSSVWHEIHDESPDRSASEYEYGSAVGLPPVQVPPRFVPVG